MAIALRGAVQGGSSTNGSDVTITFSTGAGAPLEGDVVIVCGGHGVSTTTLAAPGTGYTQLGIHVDTAPIWGAWYKVMGETPDLSVVCNGGGNSRDGVSYCAWVFSGVDATILDQTTVTVGPTTSTNPDCAAITTQTANAWVVAMAGSAVNDAAIVAPSGYSNHNTHNGNDADDLTCAGATLAVASPAETDPPSWTNWASGAWYGITIALKPAAVPDALTADDLATGTPTLTAAALGQKHVLTAYDIATGTPTLSTPVLSEVVALTADDIATGAPTLTSPAVGQVHVLTADDINAGTPTLTSAAVGQEHVLTADDLEAGAPTLTSPAITVEGDTVVVIDVFADERQQKRFKRRQERLREDLVSAYNNVFGIAMPEAAEPAEIVSAAKENFSQAVEVDYLEVERRVLEKLISQYERMAARQAVHDRRALEDEWDTDAVIAIAQALQ